LLYLDTSRAPTKIGVVRRAEPRRYFISHNLQIRAPREINKLLRARSKKKRSELVVVLVVAAIDPFDFWPFAHRRLNAAVPCASGVY
jgi:hypothetical protein